MNYKELRFRRKKKSVFTQSFTKLSWPMYHFFRSILSRTYVLVTWPLLTTQKSMKRRRKGEKTNRVDAADVKHGVCKDPNVYLQDGVFGTFRFFFFFCLFVCLFVWLVFVGFCFVFCLFYFILFYLFLCFVFWGGGCFLLGFFFLVSSALVTCLSLFFVSSLFSVELHCKRPTDHI